MNEWISDGGDCKTALATPGLLIMHNKAYSLIYIYKKNKNKNKKIVTSGMKKCQNLANNKFSDKPGNQTLRNT